MDIHSRRPTDLQ